MKAGVKVEVKSERTEHQTSREEHFCSRNVFNSEGIQGKAKTVFSPAQSKQHNALCNTCNYGTANDVN